MIEVENLTEEQKAELREKLNKEVEDKQKRTRDERDNYKDMTREAVKKSFDKLQTLSQTMAEIKAEIFEDFDILLQMKKELFNVKDTQQSHTFTTDSGLSITIGYRVNDTFDDTVHAGIEKIKNWVYGLAEGEKRAELENVINILLKKDKNGNLKASRVLELRSMAEKINNEEFMDGVRIIEEAYVPEKSSNFIEAHYKNEIGERVSVPLSITAVKM